MHAVIYLITYLLTDTCNPSVISTVITIYVSDLACTYQW